MEACPICGREFPRSRIERHANECLDDLTARNIEEAVPAPPPSRAPRRLRRPSLLERVQNAGSRAPRLQRTPSRMLAPHPVRGVVLCSVLRAEALPMRAGFARARPSVQLTYEVHDGETSLAAAGPHPEWGCRAVEDVSTNMTYEFAWPVDEYFRKAAVDVDVLATPFARLGRKRTVAAGRLTLGEIVAAQDERLEESRAAEARGELSPMWWEQNVDPLARDVWVQLATRTRAGTTRPAGRILLRCEFVSTLDLRPMGPRGARAVHRAAAGGHAALVKVLAENRGEDLWQMTSDGLTALDLAAQGNTAGHLRVVRYISGQHTLDTLERLAGASGKGADGRPKRSSTPLHHACAGGCVAIVDALRVVRSWWTVRDIAGRTPFAVAAAEGNVDVIAMMMRTEMASARDPSVSDAGDTPLMQAASRGHARVVALLLDSGASPHAVNRRGESALGLASALPPSADATAVVRALIKAGARQEADDLGRLPVHRAAEAGNCDVLSILNPVDVDCRDVHSMTPRDYARRGDDASHSKATAWLAARSGNELAVEPDSAGERHAEATLPEMSTTSPEAVADAHDTGGSSESKSPLDRFGGDSDTKGSDVEVDFGIGEDDLYAYDDAVPGGRSMLTSRATTPALGTALLTASTASRDMAVGRADSGGSDERKASPSPQISARWGAAASAMLGAPPPPPPTALDRRGSGESKSDARPRSRRARRILAAARRAGAPKSGLGSGSSGAAPMPTADEKRDTLFASLIDYGNKEWRRRTFLDAVSVEGGTWRSAPPEASATVWQVVDRDDILRVRATCVQEVAVMTKTHQPAAAVVLAACGWDAAVLGNWFLDDYETAKRDAGVVPPDVAGAFQRWLGPIPSVGESADGSSAVDAISAEVECEVCMSDVPVAATYALGCGHTYCLECWSDHLTTFLDPSATQRPDEVVATSCMASGCPIVLDESDWRILLPPTRWQDFEDILIRSFVDARADLAWCPSACGRAVRILSDAGVIDGMDQGAAFVAADVQCSCGTRFCFQCGMNPHSPAGCDEYAQWNEDRFRLLDAENYRFLMQRFKRCPKCKAYTERNRGCNHMTCRCGHQWCFMCKGPWSDHGAATGGFYKCNIHSAQKKDMLEYEEYTERDLSKLKRRNREQAKREAEYTRLHARFETEAAAVDRAVERALAFEAEARELSLARQAAAQAALASTGSWRQGLSAAVAASGAAAAARMPRVFQDLLGLTAVGGAGVGAKQALPSWLRASELSSGIWADDLTAPATFSSPRVQRRSGASLTSAGRERESQEASLVLAEAQHREVVREALAVLAEAHRVRQWVYVHEFFAAGGPAVALTEFQHQQLAAAAEALDSLCHDSLPLMSLNVKEITRVTRLCRGAIGAVCGSIEDSVAMRPELRARGAQQRPE
uniref:RBR-type E3 ubiquitin transferase n=1 Tax=Bicosoecida sp. CB-2014 TaxID=1486930 RepID=A0A7S1CCK8_9STRA|mmetsp:Transcript_21725/g.76276  ORF Transcript_21725/g.76276 Transcript_21725/m.76276 type:complete len:1403 (+) Transcript_21725:176-4384(+)